ncbi:hypothetical protein Emag_003581 [Eimeria magna]
MSTYVVVLRNLSIIPSGSPDTTEARADDMRVCMTCLTVLLCLVAMCAHEFAYASAAYAGGAKSVAESIPTRSVKLAFCVPTDNGIAKSALEDSDLLGLDETTSLLPLDFGNLQEH